MSDISEPNVVINNVFDENYMCASSSESDEESNDETYEEANVEAEVHLGISHQQAMANLEAAGREVCEETDKITVAGNLDLMDHEANNLLDEIVKNLDMPYTPADFQRVVINALALKKNVVLVSPTGSGKMNIPLLATHVLRKKFKIAKGICFITQPLTSIMNEKLNNGICKSAVLSMRGELSTSPDENEENTHLSCDLVDLLDGKLEVLFGHPESFDSPLGRKILKELQRRNRIILGKFSSEA